MSKYDTDKLIKSLLKTTFKPLEDTEEVEMVATHWQVFNPDPETYHDGRMYVQVDKVSVSSTGQIFSVSEDRMVQIMAKNEIAWPDRGFLLIPIK